MVKQQKRVFLRAKEFFLDKAVKPLYNWKADYNTNSKSYYDYLARFNHFIKIIVWVINRLLRRDITVENTFTIEFIKEGDWIGEGDGKCENYDDIINFKANIIFSKDIEQRTSNFNGNVVNVPNGSVEKTDGLWSPDYWDFMTNEFKYIDETFKDIYNEIKNIYNKIEDLQQQINVINNRLENIEQIIQKQGDSIQKIVNNLFEAGHVTNNNVETFEFITNVHIAGGTINLFEGEDQSGKYIRTTPGRAEGDIVSGLGV